MSGIAGVRTVFGSPNGLVRSPAAGAVAALVGAIIWAVFVSVTNYELSLLALMVGFLVGQAMATAGGTSALLPPIGAGLAVIGCLLGRVFIDAHYAGRGAGIGTLTALSRMAGHPGVGWDIFKAGFEALDVLYWAVAAVVAFRILARAVAARQAGPTIIEFPPAATSRSATPPTPPSPRPPRRPRPSRRPPRPRPTTSRRPTISRRPGPIPPHTPPTPPPPGL